jgi:hypothetical protein
MTFARHLITWSVLSATLIACGGSSSNGAPGGGNCSLAAGTYTEHATAEAGGTNCPPVPDQMVTISPNEDAGSVPPADAGSACATVTNYSSCTSTTSCSSTAGGYTTQFSISVSFNGTSGSGKEQIKTTDANGNVLSQCTYDLSATKN